MGRLTLASFVPSDADVEAMRRRDIAAGKRPLGFPKGTPPVVERKQKKAKQKSADDVCRDQVWERDQAVSRASGTPLERSHEDANRRGQWCHLFGRNARPEWRTDPDRQLLLSDAEHQLSDARGGNLLKILDPKTGERATDASRTVLFVWVDIKGREVKRRLSPNPSARKGRRQ